MKRKNGLLGTKGVSKSLLSPDSELRKAMLEERKKCLNDFSYFREHHIKVFS